MIFEILIYLTFKFDYKFHVWVIFFFFHKTWDEIEIEDEVSISQNNGEENVSEAKKTDAQQSYKSKLNVPLVCSSMIQNILHTICQQLTKDLTYTMIE